MCVCRYVYGYTRLEKRVKVPSFPASSPFSPARGFLGLVNLPLPQSATDAASVAEILVTWLETVRRTVRSDRTIKAVPLGLPLTT